MALNGSNALTAHQVIKVEVLVGCIRSERDEKQFTNTCW